jgi:hypothetical protein
LKIATEHAAFEMLDEPFNFRGDFRGDFRDVVSGKGWPGLFGLGSRIHRQKIHFVADGTIGTFMA